MYRLKVASMAGMLPIWAFTNAVIKSVVKSVQKILQIKMNITV